MFRFFLYQFDLFLQQVQNNSALLRKIRRTLPGKEKGLWYIFPRTKRQNQLNFHILKMVYFALLNIFRFPYLISPYFLRIILIYLTYCLVYIFDSIYWGLFEWSFVTKFNERVNFVRSNILCFLFRSWKNINVVCIVRMEMSKEP